MSQHFSQEATDQVQLIEQLLAVGTALFSSGDLEGLLNLILSKSRELTRSDAGSIYLVDRSDHMPKLLFMAAQNASQPNLSLREFAMPITRESLAGYVAITGESLNWADVYNLPTEVPYKFDRSFDEEISYRTCSVLMLPMQNHEGDTTGVLQLINRKVSREQIVTPENVMEVTQPYSDWEERVVRLLASQAAIAIERNQLQQSLETLFEDLESAGDRLTPESVPRYVQGIIYKQPQTSGEETLIQNAKSLTAQAYLVTNVLDGRTQTLYSDEQVWIVGRDRHSAIPSQNERLSRHHAAIRYVHRQGFYLIDLDSTNGSFVNGHVVRSPCLLKDRDRVRLGGVNFTFFLSYSHRNVAAIPPEVVAQLKILGHGA